MVATWDSTVRQTEVGSISGLCCRNSVRHSILSRSWVEWNDVEGWMQRAVLFGTGSGHVAPLHEGLKGTGWVRGLGVGRGQWKMGLGEGEGEPGRTRGSGWCWDRRETVRCLA
jgi:hypothetical protein